MILLAENICKYGVQCHIYLVFGLHSQQSSKICQFEKFENRRSSFMGIYGIARCLFVYIHHIIEVLWLINPSVTLTERP